MFSNQTNDSIVLMIGRAIVLMVSVITPVILVRVFSMGEYGEYRQAMLIVTTAGSIISLGMPYSLFYFFPHFPKQKGEYLARTLVLMFFSGILFCLMMWGNSSHLSFFFQNPNYNQTSVLIGVTTWLFAFSSVLDKVLLADSKVVFAAKVMVFSKLFQAPVLIGCALKGGIPLVLQGFLFTLLCKSFFSLWYFRKKYDLSFESIKLSGTMPHLKYAIPLGMGGVFSMLAESADKFMVSHYLGGKMFAVYSSGCYELPFIVVIFGSIGDVVLPIIVKLKSTNQHDKVAPTWHRAIKHSMLIGIPVFIIFFVFANQFITTVFTDNYVDAVPIFRVSLISIVLESTRYGMITRAYARTVFMWIVSMVAFLLMLLAAYFGIQYFGLMGAIASFISTRALIVSLEIVYSKHILSLQWRNLLPFGYIAKCAVLSIVCLLLPLLTSRLFVIPNSWLQLFYLMSFSFASYAYLTNYFGYWSAESIPVSARIQRLLVAIFPGRRSNCWLSL